MQNNNPNNYIQKDEINIRELLDLFINSKKIIIVITLFFSLIATIYAYSLKPNYEASSVIEVGFYNNTYILENPEEVANKLRTRFIEIPNQIKGNNILQSVSSFGDRYISVKSISTSPDIAIKNIENVQQFLINDHQTKLDNLITNIQEQIDQHYEELELLIIKNDLSTLKQRNEEEIISLTKEMQTLTFLLDDYKTLLKEVDEEIKILKSSDYDASIIILLLSEKRNLSSSFADTKIKLEKMENNLKVLESNKSAYQHQQKRFWQMKDQEKNLALEKLIKDKLDKITKIKSIIQENEYSNTSIYSEIKTNQIALNTQKIIVLGFITGFFLSIFIVLFRKTLLQEQK